MGSEDDTQLGGPGEAAAMHEKAEARYRMLFHNSSDGILLADAQTQALRYANPAAVRLLGYPLSDLPNMIVGDLFPKESQAQSLLSFSDLVTGTKPKFEVVACQTKDDTVVFADIIATSISIGGHSMIVASLREVTEGTHALHALQASELRYRRLFESAKDGIFILDGDTGRIVDANPFICTLMGYTLENFIGHRLWEIGSFKDIAAAKESFSDLQIEGYVRYEHLPLQTKDGRKIDVEFVSNVYRVNNRNVIQCNVRDITVHKRDEAALRMLDRAVAAGSQGIVITNALLPDNPIVFASPGFERMSGYAAADVFGKNCRFMQGKDTDPASVLLLAEAIAEGRASSVELLNYRKDGTPFWNHLAISPVNDTDGKLTNFVGVQTDVTERRKLESQLLQVQKMEAVGRLAAGVAHDFNNILSVILSYSDIVIGDLKPGDPVRADVEEIRRAGVRATDLTRQLLAFSRQQVLEGKVLNLHATVAGIEKMLRNLLGAGIALSILPAHALCNVRADQGQIEQVIMNLAVNARDAMPQGGELTIETDNVELDEHYAQAHLDVKAGPYVMVAVSDTGVGMDRETQARLFEPFFTTKDKGKGTGLGLATVFGIIKQSGGHIWVYSELGKGTTFKLYFPKVSGVAQAPAAEPVAVEFSRASETILLVEDDEQVRLLAQNILRRCGYVVLVAPNGGEAFLICEKHGATIHLLLTDVVLPRMSGRQLAERLEPLRPRMKVLFMSGYTDDAVLQHGVLDSGVAYLQKPLTPASLTRKVREVLDGSSGQ